MHRTTEGALHQLLLIFPLFSPSRDRQEVSLRTFTPLAVAFSKSGGGSFTMPIHFAIMKITITILPDVGPAMYQK